MGNIESGIKFRTVLTESVVPPNHYVEHEKADGESSERCPMHKTDNEVSQRVELSICVSNMVLFMNKLPNITEKSV